MTAAEPIWALAKHGPVAVVLFVVLLVPRATLDSPPPFGLRQVPAHRGVQTIPELPLRQPAQPEQLGDIYAVASVMRRPVYDELQQPFRFAQHSQNSPAQLHIGRQLALGLWIPDVINLAHSARAQHGV